MLPGERGDDVPEVPSLELHLKPRDLVKPPVEVLARLPVSGGAERPGRIVLQVVRRFLQFGFINLCKHCGDGGIIPTPGCAGDARQDGCEENHYAGEHQDAEQHSRKPGIPLSIPVVR